MSVPGRNANLPLQPISVPVEDDDDWGDGIPSRSVTVSQLIQMTLPTRAQQLNATIALLPPYIPGTRKRRAAEPEDLEVITHQYGNSKTNLVIPTRKSRMLRSPAEYYLERYPSMLNKVLQYLTSEKDLRATARVCRLWRKGVYKRIRVNHFQNMPFLISWVSREPIVGGFHHGFYPETVVDSSLSLEKHYHHTFLFPRSEEPTLLTASNVSPNSMDFNGNDTASLQHVNTIITFGTEDMEHDFFASKSKF